MPAEGITPPPLKGIARRKRKDASIPRRSALDVLYDLFSDLTPDAQRGVLEILGVIHRQALRDKAKLEAQCQQQTT